MPNYDYRCKSCKYKFEEFRLMDDRHNIVCPKCGGDVEILMSLPAVHIWKPRIFDTIDTKPILIESKKQLKEECDKRGLIPLALT